MLAFFLLMVFIFPSIIKLEHNHEHLESVSTNNENSKFFKDKCPICNFEFSAFESGYKIIELPNDNPPDNFSNNYKPEFYSSFLQFSFQLRAPPV